ncbi:hypothetical protein ACFPIJ_57995 [Dactylosporangium cerinum]|uniref:Uncharacterized protein n=1 Tax=Dactylosporangium cerinum TaxID=1434730 RepID=A0ABV9WII3_9ACTN
MPRLTRRATVKRAAALLNEGHADEARALLVRVLGHRDAATTRPDEVLFDAAVLYVDAVDADLAAVPSAIAWARYAHRTAQQLHDGDLEILQDAAQILTVALNALPAPTEAFNQACREVIHYARQRGDLATAVRTQGALASSLHASGQCAAAAAEAVAAAHMCPRHPAQAAYEAMASAFVILDVCHQHEQAAEIAAQFLVTDLPTELPFAPLLDITQELGPNLHAHTAQFHHGEPCPLPGCAVPADPSDVHTPTNGDTDAAAAQATARAAMEGGVGYPAIVLRLCAGLLAGHDPVDAPVHGPLADIADRYACLTDPVADLQASPMALAWARYAHRVRLSLLTDAAQIETATDVYAETLRRHGHPDAAETAWRDAVRHAAARGDPEGLDVVDVCRAKLAQVLYGEGRCDESLDEIRAAVHAWRDRYPQPDVVGIGLAVQAAFMHGGCHRHDEAGQYGSRIHVDVLSDRQQQRYIRGLVGSFAEQGQAHTRAHHAGERCDDPSCLITLVAALHGADASADVTDGVLADAAGVFAGVREAGEAALALFAEHRDADVSQLLAACLADFDPATVAPHDDLIAVATMYAVTTAAGPDASPSPRAWAYYAYINDRQRWPDRVGRWTATGRTAARRADEDGCHDDAIELATQLLTAALDHGRSLEQAEIRLDLADYLLNVGRCAVGVHHARIAWPTIPHDQPPAGERERFDRLLTGIRAAYLLGGCHQHGDAVSVMFDALERYAGPEPTGPGRADPDPLDPDVREQRWQSALTAYGQRREAHRAVHRHGPCDDDHEGGTLTAEQHTADIVELIHARRNREIRA